MARRWLLSRLCPLLVTLATWAWAAPAAAQGPHVVYLNFSDGTETLRQGLSDDAPTNTAQVGAAAPYPPFRWPTVTTGTTTRAELIGRIARRVHEVFLPYDVLITLTRPAAGPYTMVMIGGRPRDVGLDLDVAGIAFMDCTDAQPSNLVFAFAEVLRGNEQGLVATIAQEAAHAFGLEHTDRPEDLMHPTVDPRQTRFLDEQMPLLGDRACGRTTQNSHRRLLELVGAWAGPAKPLDDGTRADGTPPRLVLLDPPEGGGPLPQPLRVRAEVNDEGGIDQVILAVRSGDASRGGPIRQVRQRPPFDWALGGLPAGPLSLVLTAIDRSGNVQTLERQLVLEADPGPGGCGVAPGRSAPQEGSHVGWGLLLLTMGLASAVRLRPCGLRRHPL
jgi:hypothetical protein